MEISRDPVVNIIYQGIKEPIMLCMKNSAVRAALQLMYAAIDSLTMLGLPEGQERATRKDYAAWCEKYLKFNTQENVRGLEWFAARCGLLHNYTAESKLSKDGKVRMVAYYSGEGPDIIYRPKESESLVMVRIEGLIDAFYKALDTFIVDLYAKRKKEDIEKRFNKMFHILPYEQETASNK